MRGDARRTLDHPQLLSHLLEDPQRLIEIISTMGSGEHDPDPGLPTGHGREPQGHSEETLIKELLGELKASGASPSITGVMGVSLRPVSNPRFFISALK